MVYDEWGDGRENGYKMHLGPADELFDRLFEKKRTLLAAMDDEDQWRHIGYIAHYCFGNDRLKVAERPIIRGGDTPKKLLKILWWSCCHVYSV